MAVAHNKLHVTYYLTVQHDLIQLHVKLSWILLFE